jgi:hypothetical protein
METRMTIKFSDITGGGIPYGNTAGRPTPTVGRLYSNGEAARLELYTQASGWQNIVQETPGVSSISGTYLESAGTGTITISGTNFVSGCYATAIGSNGVQYDATSTTFNSIVQITAVFTGLSNQYEPYDIKVTNPSNLFGIIPDALYINAVPVWQTASGSLGTVSDNFAISVSAVATDSDSTVTYSLASGSSLPAGVTLNSSTGVISGTAPDVTSNTTYTFTINASDGVNPAVPRTFSFVVNAAPTWVTASGSLGTFTSTSNINITLSATDPTDTVTYSLFSGSLPSGISLNSSTGVISGTLPEVESNTTFNFTIMASDSINFVSRSFSIVSAPVTVFYTPFTSNNTESINNVTPTQNTNGGVQSIAGYSGLRLSSQKTAFDGNIPSFSRMTGPNWTVEYWIYKNSTNSGATEIEVGNGESFYVTGLLARPGDPYFKGNQLSWGRNRTTGQWVHVAYVGDNGTLREYENGVQVNSSVRDTSINAPSGIWLGGSQHTVPSGSSQTMDGYLRKVRLSATCRYPGGTTFSPSSVFPI